MQYRTLGKTGERVSAIGLGGAHGARPDDLRDATRLIRAAIDGGINREMPRESSPVVAWV